jgi:hypothetical protein
MSGGVISRAHRSAALLLGLLAFAAPRVSPAITITVSGALGDLDSNGDSGTGEAAVLQTAVACWSARIATNRAFTLNVETKSLTDARGIGEMESVDGSNVPTSGRITIDDGSNIVWYVDPAPLDSTEFMTPDPDSGWRFIDGPSSSDDLLRAVFHEIGHALGWSCGDSCQDPNVNPSYDALMVPQPGSFVDDANCSSPFPLASEPPLAGCVSLVDPAPLALDVSLRGDGLGGSGSTVANELSHPGIRGDLMHGIGVGAGERELPTIVDVDVFAHAYGDTVNLPPTVDAGQDKPNVECNAPGGASVTLDGTGTTDPEGRALTFAWTCPGITLANADTATPSGFFPLGGEGVTCRLDATDLDVCPPTGDTVEVKVVDTTAPDIACPAPVSAECVGPSGTPADSPTIASFLQGASATDACDPSPTVTNDAPASFPLGVTPVTFTAVDHSGHASPCVSNVTVVDTVAPTVTCPADATVECASAGGIPASDPAIVAFLSGATATDVCDPMPSIGNDAPSFFPTGSTLVTFTARDAGGLPMWCTATVTVVDTRPPTIEIRLDPEVLWPPNHELRPITATVVATDVCTPEPTVRLVAITSSEPENATGDGHTAPDVEGASLGTDDRAFLLRAERRGNGEGRVYTVRYVARDFANNETAAEATVVVPHDRKVH